jgi:hypothetical protein
VSKLILMSVLFATIAIPVWGARDQKPRAGLKRSVIRMLVFNLVYLLLLLYVYPPIAFR